MGNGRTKKEGKQLEIARTVIGIRKGKYHGEPVEFTIYYGNLSLPLIDNGFVHLTLQKYESMLHHFLYETEEGATYAVPSEEESRKAMQLVLDKEDELLRQILKQDDSKTDLKEPISNGPVNREAEQKEPDNKESAEAILTRKEPVAYDREELESLYHLKELDEPKKTDEEAAKEPAEKNSDSHQYSKPDPVIQPGELFNRLKTRAAVQSVLIIFQFICIVILAILLIKRG